MILSRFVKLQLVFLTVASVIAAGVLGVYFLRVPEALGVGRYEITASFEKGAQLYEGAEVNYQGSPVGKVTDMELANRGITVTMRLESAYDLPSDVGAEIHSRSAVGEQYVDLVQPAEPSPVLLQAGAEIPMDRTGTPVEIGPLLDNVGRLVDSVPTEDLNALLAETSTGLDGRADDLGSLIDSTSSFVDAADANLDPTRKLLTDFEPVAGALNDTGANVDSFTQNLASVTAALKANDKSLRALLDTGPQSATQIRSLFSALEPVLPGFLAQLDRNAEVFGTYNAGLAQILTDYPRLIEVVGSVTLPFANTDKVALDLANLNDPPICSNGFIAPKNWRDPADTSLTTPPRVFCDEPADDPRVVKGARNILCERYPGTGLRAATPALCDARARARGISR